MSRVKAFVAIAYALQAFVVVPWFLGAMYRREQSLWVWKEYARDIARFGERDAALTVYLYFIFYLSLAVIPYFVLCFRYPVDEPGVKKPFREGRILLSLWLAGSFFLFARPLHEFFSSLPSDIWNGWLMIFWVASAVAAGFVVLSLERRIKKMSKSPAVVGTSGVLAICSSDTAGSDSPSTNRASSLPRPALPARRGSSWPAPCPTPHPTDRTNRCSR